MGGILNELALFAGAGGGILGGHLLGWRTVCAVEWDAYAAAVLVARQNDRCLPPFPIWDDVQTFDGLPWRGIIDIVSGGFPCQDISVAGKGAGISGEKSSMWQHMARIIGEVRPQFAFVENSPMLTSRGLGDVLGDLAEMGYDSQWGIFSAREAGAPHVRERIFILAADNDSDRKLWRNTIKNKKFTKINVFDKFEDCRNLEEVQNLPEFAPSLIWRKNNGIPGAMDRLKCLGNAQVPAVAAMAFCELIKGF
jgi:DNA (cytosine-5)-methyltransferase 1